MTRRDANDSESKLFWKLEKRPEIFVEPSLSHSSPRQLLGPGSLSCTFSGNVNTVFTAKPSGRNIAKAHLYVRSQNYYRVNPLRTAFHTPKDNRDISLNYIISVGSQPVFHVIRRQRPRTSGVSTRP